MTTYDEAVRRSVNAAWEDPNLRRTDAPTHEDFCILSRIYNDREIPVPHGTNFRINEWLKAQIAGALTPPEGGTAKNIVTPAEVPEWVDAAALQAAREIIALSESWTYTQRRAAIQVIIAREMMRAARTYS